MVGDIEFVEDRVYVHVNNAGTLEKLPRMPWWRQLTLYIRSRRGRMSLDDVRKACTR